jgi:ubiquinone biosynthesis monooxygenase Coq7
MQTLELTESERRRSGALMRVNHVGEVCAQALYEGHALATKDPALRRFFRAAAQEEADHLSWTGERLEQLRERPSLLNPVWYAGALGIGYLAGRLGDRTSLGFMRETERQVEAHLAAHMERLPHRDEASRAIVLAMKHDEAVHAQQAALHGAIELPTPVKFLMRCAARLMTGTARVL